MRGVWVGLGLGALVAVCSASALSRRQPSASLRAKRALSELPARLKRQTETTEYVSTGYEYLPGGYEYTTVYEDLTGTAYYWYLMANGKKQKKLRALPAGYFWWTNAAGVKVKKKKVIKSAITKKKKKSMKKKKKIIKKKKKKIVTTTTTTTPKPTTPPPPPPACPDPTPNYEYIPIMEYVTQPQVESVPIYEERVVPDWSMAGSSQWGYARPLTTSFIPQQAQSRRYFMMRRRDGSDGLGQMGLGQLQNFLQNQISYSSLNGGTRVIPASGWSSGLSRTIRGGSRSLLGGGSGATFVGGSSLGGQGLGSSLGSSLSSIGSPFGSSLGPAPSLPGYRQGSSSGSYYAVGQRPRNAFEAGSNFGTSYNWGSRTLNTNKKKKKH